MALAGARQLCSQGPVSAHAHCAQAVTGYEGREGANGIGGGIGVAGGNGDGNGVGGGNGNENGGGDPRTNTRWERGQEQGRVSGTVAEMGADTATGTGTGMRTGLETEKGTKMEKGRGGKRALLSTTLENEQNVRLGTTISRAASSL